MKKQSAAPRLFPSATARRLSALLARELAAIGTIEIAMVAEKRPLYAVFLRAAKESHQTVAAQLEALLRLGHRPARQKPPLMAKAMKAQVAVTQRVNPRWTLDAMLGVEESLLAAYRREAQGATGVLARALRTIVAHGRLRVHVLAAHLARSMSPCMRCLLERPATGPGYEPLRREDPAIFVCAACHEETLASFPEDLRATILAAPPHLREDHVIERALGRPSKETARRTVYTTLVAKTAAERSALAIPPPAPKVVIAPSPPSPSSSSDKSIPCELALDEATPREAEYTRALFDPSAFARAW